MKKILWAIIIFCLSFQGYAQNNSKDDLEAYFSAIIVRDFDASIAWYTQILGFKAISNFESEENGVRQANLQNGDVLIELIELERALDPAALVPNFDKNALMVGIFKIGFRVADFDKWISHLTNEKADFVGSVIKDTTTGKRMVIITDPDGNRLQIFEK